MLYTKEMIKKGEKEKYRCVDVGVDECGNYIYFYRRIDGEGNKNNSL